MNCERRWIIIYHPFSNLLPRYSVQNFNVVTRNSVCSVCCCSGTKARREGLCDTHIISVGVRRTSADKTRTLAASSRHAGFIQHNIRTSGAVSQPRSRLRTHSPPAQHDRLIRGWLHHSTAEWSASRDILWERVFTTDHTLRSTSEGGIIYRHRTSHDPLKISTGWVFTASKHAGNENDSFEVLGGHRPAVSQFRSSTRPDMQLADERQTTELARDTRMVEAVRTSAHTRRLY